MAKINNALILSAGWGTRLRPLTFYRPKVFTPFKGKPLLQKWIEVLTGYGIKRIFVNFHALSTCFKHFAEYINIPQQVELHFLFEKSILGSGGSILKVIKRFNPGSLVVVNGDTVLNLEQSKMYDFFNRWNGGVKLALTHNPIYNNIVVDSAGNILRFRSQPTEQEKEAGIHCLAFMGIHMLESKIFANISWKNDFVDIIEIYKSMLSRKCISYEYLHNVEWYDIGTPRSYFMAHFNNESKSYYRGLNSQIHPDAHIKKCILWDDVLIKENVRLKSCIVLDGIILSNKTLENCIITKHGCYRLC